LFDRDGVQDQIGTINLLTPEVVANAAKEVKAGISVVLNWPLNRLHEPGFGRIQTEHKFIDWRTKGSHPFFSYDDELRINTQSGIYVFVARCRGSSCAKWL